MCYLAYYPPGVMPVREHLENGVRLNPHGCGYAIGSKPVRRSLSAEGMINKFLVARKRHLNQPAMFHARNATGDSPVTLENVQPVRVTLRYSVAHNGYLFPHEEGRSDSRIFAAEILPRYNLSDPGSRVLLEQRMGPSKAVILSLDGGYILNAHLGIPQYDGTWHSNRDYLGISHLATGQCPQCHTETDLTPVCESCEYLAQRRRGLLMGTT